MEQSAESIGALDTGRASGDGPAIVERVRCCVEQVSLGFGQWNDPYAHGPGLYFVVERDSATPFAEPMGTNRWPVEDCTSVFDSLDALSETARNVAFGCDGAVVVHNDGTIEEEMVRMKQLSTPEREQAEGLQYGGWMGARHMSALETSTRDEVFSVITVSEEDGRITTFRDGTFEDYPREELGNEWQVDD